MRRLRYLPGIFHKALSSIWRNATGKGNHVRIGDQEIEVKPIKAKAALEIVLLIAPYLRDVIPILIATRNLEEPGLFRETMRTIMVDMANTFPQDVLSMMSIFLGVDEEWLEKRFYPEEMIEAFGVAMRVNHLDDLMRLGLSVGMISFADLGWLRGITEE